MFPFIDPVLVRFCNDGERPVKIGYVVIGAGASADVPVSTLHAPALVVARDSGVRFVGFVVGGDVYGLVPLGEEVPSLEEVMAKVIEEEIIAEIEEKPDFISSIDFAEKTDKELAIDAIEAIKSNEPMPEIDWSAYKKAELKVILQDNNLDDSGLKDDLIARLQENDIRP